MSRLVKLAELNLCSLTPEHPQPWPTYSPPGCWGRDILNMRARKLEYLPQSWVPDMIEGTPALVDLPQRIPDQQEFLVLHAYRLRLRPQFATQVRRQDEADFSTWLLYELAKPLLARLPAASMQSLEFKLTRVLSTTEADAEAVVVQQKLLFNRARPYQIDGTLDPMFRPGHPSYPSGHSTVSFAVAFVVCGLISAATDPHKKLDGVAAEVLGKAHGIALNREIAGVHYPSDTRAGIQLARQIVDHYLLEQGFQQEVLKPLIIELNALIY